jgi:hypothetical protein
VIERHLDMLGRAIAPTDLGGENDGSRAERGRTLLEGSPHRVAPRALPDVG